MDRGGWSVDLRKSWLALPRETGEPRGESELMAPSPGEMRPFPQGTQRGPVLLRLPRHM